MPLLNEVGDTGAGASIAVRSINAQRRLIERSLDLLIDDLAEDPQIQRLVKESRNLISAAIIDFERRKGG